MEQKKIDINSIIGFILIFGILVWIMYQNQPDPKKVAAEKAQKELVEKAQKQKQIQNQMIATATQAVATGDSTQIVALQKTLGDFAYSATLPSAKTDFTTLENEVIRLKIANKGGYIAEATLKNFEKFKKGSKQIVELIKNNNAQLNLVLPTKDNRALQSKDLFFEPTLSKNGQDQILSMKLKSGPNAFIEYQYVLKPNDYMIGFDLRSQGMSQVLNTAQPLNLEWDLKGFRNEKSISYENKYTEIYYEHKDGKVDYAGLGQKEEEALEQPTFIAFKQHFFTSILVSKTPFEKAQVQSTNLVNEEKVDTVYTKAFKAKLPLAFTNGELDHKLSWYMGPSDYDTLAAYDLNLEKIISMGWGIIGWINRFIFVPLFGLLGSFIPYGIAIILFTILIKLAMSPITFKSFLSQAKMKVLRPEITELGEKFAKDPMKKQQETMKLYNKAGVNPMAGCIPALIQMPFLMASFQFFPSAFELRQKSFLWADDLSSFDEIVKLPFHIPLYGDHISLFPILAAIAIFFYMKMTSGDQQMAAPQQEGMPDMAKMMKIMIYVSPLMMLFFFNSYGAGLSLYNFISNLVTIAIMLVIKNYFIDSDKIHAQIQENKLKEPKKQSRFQRKLQEAMEQAEAQKAANQKRK